MTVKRPKIIWDKNIDIDAPRSSHHASPGIPTGFTVSIYRPNGRKISSLPVATGKFDESSQRWEFTSDEDALKTWLNTTFNLPTDGRGSELIPIMSIAHIVRVGDIALPRKGLTLKWTSGAKK